MEKHLKVLQCGSCEPLKLAVHGAALGLAAVMTLYNAAAWLARRERHLGLNAVLYTALTVWEQQHVSHHLDELRRVSEPAALPSVSEPPAELGRIAA